MAFSFIPDYSFRKMCDITPGLLKKIGIDFLMLDMDNTIAPYKTAEAPEEVRTWAASLKEAGIGLFIVSNSKRNGRTEKFAAELGVPFIKHARKPSRRGVLEAMRISGRAPDSSALCGDQIFTDVLCANRAGIRSFIVFPIKFTNVFLRLRYWLEVPFRLMCRNMITK